MKYIIFIFFIFSFTIQGNSQIHQKNRTMSEHKKNPLENCDIDTGLCALPNQEKDATTTTILPSPKLGTIIYVGDPMCSWCWGIAEELEQLKTALQEDYDFQLIVGGLRPGGGDEWNATFKDFLREHWTHVTEKSGQAFSFDLLEKEYFNYDTEPSCRAVRVVRDIAPEKEFAFFKAVQYGFYYKNEDPKAVSFYQSICKEMNISFEDFSGKFQSDTYKKLVREDFAKPAEMGIRGFPSIVLKKGEQLYLIASGYAEFEQMKARIEEVKQ